MRRLAMSSTFVPLVLVACASAPTAAVVPIEPLRFLEAELLVQPAVRGIERVRFDPLGAEELEGARSVATRARFLALDPAVAERHLGTGARGLIAFVVPKASAARMLAELEAEPAGFEIVNETSLTMPEGQEGHVCVAGQRAFVSGFTLVTDGLNGMADPRVDVAVEGTQLVVTADLDASGEHVALDLRLDGCRLADAFDETVLELGGARVTVQQPRGFLRSLSTRVVLARDESLLIGGASLADDGSSVATIVLVEAEAQPADATL